MLITDDEQVNRNHQQYSTMSKKTKAATAATTQDAQLPGQGAALAEARKNAAAAAQKDQFVFVKKAEAKIAPQAQTILNTIEAAGTITREELVKALTGVLQTRQPVGRIVSYYQKLLTGDTGCVTLTKGA